MPIMSCAGDCWRARDQMRADLREAARYAAVKRGALGRRSYLSPGIPASQDHTSVGASPAPRPRPWHRPRISPRHLDLDEEPFATTAKQHRQRGSTGTARPQVETISNERSPSLCKTIVFIV